MSWRLILTHCMKIKFLNLAIAVLMIISCKEKQKDQSKLEDTNVNLVEQQDPFFKLSLAQWSLNEPIRSGDMNPLDFAQKASEMGFEGIEYVNQLYTPMMEEYESPEVALDSILPKLKAKSEQYNVRNVLIMVDHEGELASKETNLRDEAVNNHKKWVDAAAYLGCHSIRVNLFGSEDDEAVWKTNAADGLTKLSEYAATKNINVIVENHGGFSSNAALLSEVINDVGMSNCGTLPDFGNFCVKREGGERWGTPCIDEYPIYQGVKELMPNAFAVSAKAYEFDEQGQETKIDYKKMLQLVKDAGYTGYIGVEYEGDLDDPEEGIELTKNLLITAAQNLN